MRNETYSSDGNVSVSFVLFGSFVPRRNSSQRRRRYQSSLTGSFTGVKQNKIVTVLLHSRNFTYDSCTNLREERYLS